MKQTHVDAEFADDSSAPYRVACIISGGQTGVDRAALDVAMALRIRHGGFVPAGRRAEDGRIPEMYALTELASPDYDERTERNVMAGDATLILSMGPLTGGSATTRRMARRHDKPWCHIDLARHAASEAVGAIRTWLLDFRPQTLNVAGPRESTTPGIYDAARGILTSVFSDGP